jgi:hypothetical protein
LATDNRPLELTERERAALAEPSSFPLRDALLGRCVTRQCEYTLETWGKFPGTTRGGER